MTKVVFNKDGSIKNVLLPSYVTQGSTGESDALKLAVAIDGEDITAPGYSAIAYFKLPNGDRAELAFGGTGTLEVAGETYPCKYVYLDSSVTLYEGIVLVSIRVAKNVGSTETYTYNWRLVVNPTNFDPYDDETNIKNAQYENLVDMLSQFVNYKKLPYFEVQETDIVIDFINDNNILNKPIIIKILDNTRHRYLYLIGVIQKASAFPHVQYEFYDLGSRARILHSPSLGFFLQNDTTFATLLSSSSYELLEQEINKVTSMSSESTNTQYPSAKAVWDLSQHILGVAEGKTESWVIDTTLDIATIKAISGMVAGHFYVYNSTTKTWEDKVTNLLAGDYDNLNVINSSFDSTNNTIDAASISGPTYLICGQNTGAGSIFYLLLSWHYNYGSVPVSTKYPKMGDIFYIVKRDVPDRWCGTVGQYNALESKTDLSSYVTTNTDQTITGVKTFRNGIIIDNSGVPNKWTIVYDDGKLSFNFGSLRKSIAFTTDGSILPYGTQNTSLGGSYNKFAKSYIVKYMDGKNSTYGLVSPDTTSWTADQTIATEDYVDDAVDAAAVSVSPYYMHSKVTIKNTSGSDNIIVPIVLTPIISSRSTAATTEATLLQLIEKYIWDYDEHASATTYQVPCVAGKVATPAPGSVDLDVVAIRYDIQGNSWYAVTNDTNYPTIAIDTIGGNHLTITDDYVNRL